MKFSPILSLFSLLLCPSLVVLALPQGPQDVQVHAPEFKGDKDWPPEAPPPFNDIYFSWCRDYNVSSTCFGRGLKHGFCCKMPNILHHLLQKDLTFCFQMICRVWTGPSETSWRMWAHLEDNACCSGTSPPSLPRPLLDKID